MVRLPGLELPFPSGIERNNNVKPCYPYTMVLYMQQLKEIHYRFVIFLSVILSPMVYLVSGVVNWVQPPPLGGLVFIFGELSWFPFRIHNPIHTRHFLEFTYLLLIWLLVGTYLTLNFPHRTGERTTLIGHLAAFGLLIVTPYLVFVDYTFVLLIPLPITPILSLLVLGIYIRNQEHNNAN